MLALGNCSGQVFCWNLDNIDGTPQKLEGTKSKQLFRSIIFSADSRYIYLKIYILRSICCPYPLDTSWLAQTMVM